MIYVFLQRIKLVVLVVFSFLVLSLNEWKLLAALMVFLVILSNARGLRRQLKERMLSLFTIAIFVVLFQLIFSPLENFSLRLMAGVTASIKITLLSLLVFFYTTSNSPTQILAAFSFLPRNLQLMLTITFGLIPTVFQEVRKIMLTQKTRGYNPKWWNPRQSLIPLVIPLLHRVLRRSEQIAMVLYSRGYGTD